MRDNKTKQEILDTTLTIRLSKEDTAIVGKLRGKAYNVSELIRQALRERYSQELIKGY